MNKIFSIFLSALAVSMFLTGCNTAAEELARSSGNKNITIDGYVLWGTVDTVENTGGMPVGKLIIGRAVYKSRKVGIPADQKVPNTGNFKSTKSKNLFGAEEHIIEYDYTAGSESEAASAVKKLETMKQEALSEDK